MAIAIPFVAAFEGFYPRVYRDEVGVKTICYGQTAADGADFTKVYTKAQCEAMLGRDLAKYDKHLQQYLTPAVYAALPTKRHAALISFDYNLGPGNTRRIAPYFNRGDWRGGCRAMLGYNHAGGRVLAGLTRRRQAEYKLCIQE
jgi:lysozyme